jgi:hypothetical protein
MAKNTRASSTTKLAVQPVVLVALAPEQLIPAAAGPLPVIAF